MQKVAPRKQAADRKAIDAELPLYSVLPTTPAGAAALIEYVHSDAHWQWQGPGTNTLTVMDYSKGFQNRELRAAIKRFQLHIAASLRAMAERGLA